jgi:dimethylargininase
MVRGLTSAGLGPPDYHRALAQHRAYITALEECGLDVTVLPADEAFPDSTFVEDTALLIPGCAILTRPGARSRTLECAAMREPLSRFYDVIEAIEAPGFIEAGDIMMVDDFFYIGLSERTDPNGARQMIDILHKHGMDGEMIELEEVLHLKTGVSYLENNDLLVCGEFVNHERFTDFNQLVVEADEAYAANSVWINNVVLTPAGFPNTRALIEAAGHVVREVDVSEFQKLDGGPSCLSLRF